MAWESKSGRIKKGKDQEGKGKAPVGNQEVSYGAEEDVKSKVREKRER